jgi:hypothetical protein
MYHSPVVVEHLVRDRRTRLLADAAERRRWRPSTLWRRQAPAAAR